MASDAPGTRGLTVVGELVVDLIPDLAAGAGPEGTAPHFVARPGGNALNVAVTAGRLYEREREAVRRARAGFPAVWARTDRHRLTGWLP